MDPRLPDSDPWKCVRTTLVPQDIPGVKARTPVRRRRSTPWTPQPDGTATTVRCGEREWFSDRLFVECEQPHASAGYGSSFTVHAVLVGALLAYVIAQPQTLAVVTNRSHLTMPVVVAPIPVMPDAPVARASELRPATAPKPASVPPPPPPVAELKPAAAAAPIEEPPSIGPDNGSTGPDGHAAGDAAGVPGGVPGGVVGGLVGGGAAAPGPAAPAVIRVGPDIKAPRKIKDARPVYPDGALAGRGRGSVIIEAIIGPDGKIRQARVVSPPSIFDQAAVEAVRQWEYEPPTMNGVVVAVAMTVAVTFSLQ